MRERSACRWLWLSLIIIVIDQISKYLIMKHLSLYQSKFLLPFLNFNLQHNYGAAFSFLNSAGGWQKWLFVVVAVIVSLVILYLLRKTPAKHYGFAAGLCLILGGALGNVIDRIRLGYVIDFVDFHINTWHFAVFNLADTAITLGVIILFIGVLFSSSKKMPLA